MDLLTWDAYRMCGNPVVRVLGVGPHLPCLALRVGLYSQNTEELDDLPRFVFEETTEG